MIFIINSNKFDINVEFCGLKPVDRFGNDDYTTL